MIPESWLSRSTAIAALILVALITVPAIILTTQVKLDHEFERFFSSGDPELLRYEAFREEFGNDNDFMFICPENLPSVFERQFLLRLDSLGLELGTLKDVRNVISPTRIIEPRVTPTGVFKVPWLRLDEEATLALDSARIWKDPRLVGNLFAKTGESIMLIVETEEHLSKVRSDSLLLAIEVLINKYGFQDARLAGRIHGQHYYIKKMESEISLFFSISVVLLTFFLAVAFRSYWGVFVPVLVVLLAVLWQIALMTLLGLPLTIMTMLLPTILFVVGMSDAVHIIERYIESLRNGKGKIEALAITYREVGAATFLTSVTTAIGFLTLTTSSIGPIIEFGVLTAVGVGIAFILAFTLLPAILILVKTPVMVKEKSLHNFWTRTLNSWFLFVVRQPKFLLLSFGILTAGSIYLASQMEVDNSLLEDLSDDDPRKQDFFYFEKHFGGVRPFEMALETVDTSKTIWDLGILRQIETVENDLKNSYGVESILSPVSLVYSANKSLNGGSFEFYKLPSTQKELDRIVKLVNRAGDQGMRSIVSDDHMRARLSGRMVDEGGAIHSEKNKALEHFISQNTDQSEISFAQTGMAFLIDRNNATLSKQLITGLSIAFILVSLIMAYSFRNWRMVIIALIPNVVPLLFLAAFMVLMDIDLKVSTSIVFTIAFGIAVDDSIHLLGKLKLELAKGRSIPMAMRRSFCSAGKAVIITSIMLISGFIGLVFSDFGSVYYMGLLVSLTLFLAIIADLFLLPVLVLWLLPRRKA